MRHLISALALAAIAACAHEKSPETAAPDMTNAAAASQHPHQGHGRKAGHPYGRPPHLKTAQSTQSFEETVAGLRDAIETRGLKIFAVVDHAAGAASVGETLAPSTLFIFGNPKVGTPLMQAAPTIAIDLPLRMLVFVDAAGAIKIAWPDMAHNAHMHGARGAEPVVETISAALAEIAAAGAGDAERAQ